jgi:hypothetical protein
VVEYKELHKAVYNLRDAVNLVIMHLRWYFSGYGDCGLYGSSLSTLDLLITSVLWIIEELERVGVCHVLYFRINCGGYTYIILNGTVIMSCVADRQSWPVLKCYHDIRQSD